MSDAQTAGRGRQGRSWTSPREGPAFLGLPAPGSPARPAGVVTAIGAIAICEALESASRIPHPASLQIRWPNDLYVGDRKLCGILAESRTDQGRPEYVLGIGLNVNSSEADWPQEIRERTTSLLRETGRKTDRRALLESILDRIEAHDRDARAQETKPLQDAWRRRSSLVGSRVRLHLGDRRVEGTVERAGFAEGIVLRTDNNQLEPFQAEHVTLVEPLPAG